MILEARTVQGCIHCHPFVVRRFVDSSIRRFVDLVDVDQHWSLHIRSAVYSIHPLPHHLSLACRLPSRCSPMLHGEAKQHATHAASSQSFSVQKTRFARHSLDSSAQHTSQSSLASVSQVQVDANKADAFTGGIHGAIGRQISRSFLLWMVFFRVPCPSINGSALYMPLIISKSLVHLLALQALQALQAL